jgi:hypothetical protein
MEREIIRVEPFDTNFEKWGAPVSVCTRAGDMVFVSGLPPFDPDTGELLQHAPFERQAEIVGGLIAYHRIYWGWKGCTLIAPALSRRGSS